MRDAQEILEYYDTYRHRALGCILGTSFCAPRRVPWFSALRQLAVAFAVDVKWWHGKVRPKVMV